ncbi:MAG: hypothetical protein GX100_09405 [candidate division WS1 bacterium]|nr:hypothetical protein [candidate division WS1 bacterium]
MLEDSLQRHASAIPGLMDGSAPRQVEPLIARLAADERWDLMSIMVLTATEVPARLMINCLLENRRYMDLVPAACLRRQQRRIDRLSAAVGSNVLRDWDSEEGEGGIPEEIRNDLEDLATSAAARRQVASFQAAEVDRDPLREYIVTQLAERLNRDPEALKTMIVIARASAWEETRRTAAMKIANNRRLVDRMVKSGWSRQLVEVAASTSLDSARRNIAGRMAVALPDYIAQADRPALEFLAEYAPEERVQSQAQSALDSLAQ